MLMLTHTRFLKEFIGADHISRDNLDIFAYNVFPDLLPVHESITPEMTHGIPRFSRLPQKYHKAAFVQFHLLVDDMAHYGKICEKAVINFNPNSNGYAYVKGRPLIQPIMDFYKDIGDEISFSEAAYRSHMIIEMSFDLTLQREDSSLATLFSEALNYTVENKQTEFSKTLSWIFGIKEKIITEAINRAVAIYTKEWLEDLMSLEGRVSLFVDKFCYGCDDGKARNDVGSLFDQGMDLVTDYKDFLHTTLNAIKDSGFRYPL